MLCRACPCSRVFESRITQWILRFVQRLVATISTQPCAIILLVQRPRVRGAVPFSAWTHWHSYLTLFAHTVHFTLLQGLPPEIRCSTLKTVSMPGNGVQALVNILSYLRVW
jgi:hypothetical protein